MLCVVCSRHRWIIHMIGDCGVGGRTFGEAKHCNNGAGKVIRETLSLSLSLVIVMKACCFDSF